MKELRLGSIPRKRNTLSDLVTLVTHWIGYSTTRRLLAGETDSEPCIHMAGLVVEEGE